MTPTLLPVLRESRQHQLHKPADQIGTLAGRQHQQPGIIDHQRQARAPLLLLPADEAVAGSEVQRGGTPGGQSHPLAAIFGHVTKMFAHQLGAFQIMMLGDQLVAFLVSVPWHRPYDQSDQNLLFVRGRLAETGEFLFHARQPEKNTGGCPAKSIYSIFRERVAAMEKRALSTPSRARKRIRETIALCYCLTNY